MVFQSVLKRFTYHAIRRHFRIITRVIVSQIDVPRKGLSGDQNTLGFGQVIPQ